MNDGNNQFTKDELKKIDEADDLHIAPIMPMEKHTERQLRKNITPAHTCLP